MLSSTTFASLSREEPFAHVMCVVQGKPENHFSLANQLRTEQANPKFVVRIRYSPRKSAHLSGRLLRQGRRLVIANWSQLLNHTLRKAFRFAQRILDRTEKVVLRLDNGIYSADKWPCWSCAESSATAGSTVNFSQTPFPQ